ncbi:MAG: addiction module protein [Burkholderiaceae bacterium]
MAFLFEPVALHPDLLLDDIFKLLDVCPVLKDVFRRNWAVELCDEARKGPLALSRGSDPAETAGVEYLELYWSWELDTSSNTYQSISRLNLHGIGPVLTKDSTTHGVKAGDRIKWSLSLTPVRELLALPLRLNEEITLREDDLDAKGYGDVVATGRCSEVLLGQVIEAVLDELSFHGGPQEQAEFAAELKARIDEIDSGTAELVSGDDLFEEFDRPGFDALFETLGGVSPADVRRAMRQIEDEEAAGPFLEREFDGKVVVKEQFRERAGREFRKAFRAAGR